MCSHLLLGVTEYLDYVKELWLQAGTSNEEAINVLAAAKLGTVLGID